MRKLTQTLALVLVAGLSSAPGLCGTARAAAPELMERAVLPAMPALSTCACAVPLRDGDQLVVGLANGEVVSFHESAGNVIPRTASLPGSGPIDDIVACRVGRAAGSANEFALLVVRGAELFSIGFGDMSVAGRTELPAPRGRYRFARAARDQDAVETAYVAGADHPILFDDDSAMCVTVETRALLAKVTPVVDRAAALSVTALSDRETVVAGSRVIECSSPTGEGLEIDERTYLVDEPVRVAIGRVLNDGRTLELKISDPESIWISRRVDAPGRISTTVSISDSLVAMGGTAALTPSYDIGWVALVDHRGKVTARSDHARPVTNITRVSGFIAVQGDGRNLSVYDMNLRPLWDHDSPVTDVVLLAGDFVGGEAEDLAVVGTRAYGVSSADADSIRSCLAMPDFMAGAIRTDWGLELERSFITFYVSNEEKLRRMQVTGLHDAGDAFGSGDIDGAIAHATSARAAAAVLGDHRGLVALSSRIHEFASFRMRRRSLLLVALVLAALGIWVAIESARRTSGPFASGVAALLLFVTGAWAWRLIGDAGLNPALFAGGAVAALVVVRTRVTATRSPRVSGAAIEDLIRVLMEFLHGAGEGVPSDGVVDTARKSVTKVAYLAQEMVDSTDDSERFEMLKKRLRSRGDDFLDTTYPRVAVLLSNAKQAGIVVHETEQMAAAADRMRSGIAAILSGVAQEPSILRHQLQAIKEGRDQLATAADRAWAIVQTNPGCSLTQSIDRILREKEEELTDASARVGLTEGVPPGSDAIALWSFQFRYVLENLVTNALRAMRDSGTSAITIETATDGEVCTVRFTDTGCGMTAEHAAQIFRSKPEERDGGSGLPSSRALLQERGGDLSVEQTAPGKGTTFLLTIPHWTANTGDTHA